VIPAVTQPRKRIPTLVLPAPPVTVEALDAAEADDGRVELLDGLCVLRPWPTPLRTRVTQRLSRHLEATVPSGAHVYPHGVSLRISARSLLAPDIVVGPAPAAEGRRLTELPFLVVEVADESTRRYDRTLKLDLYRERGVPSCWLVEPAAATAAVEVFDLVDGQYVRTGQAHGSDALTVTRPFPITVVPADLVDPPD
jgi:Uma2 family endonuclease